MFAIRKFSALLLAILATCFILGSWMAINLRDGLLAQAVLRRALGMDSYTLLAYLLYVGFTALWTILVIRKQVARKDLLVFLVITNVLGAGWLWLMAVNGTMKGFYTAVWSNWIIIGINALFSLFYFFEPNN